MIGFLMIGFSMIGLLMIGGSTHLFIQHTQAKPLEANFEELMKTHPKMKSVSLVSKEKLARHNLPKTQRSFLHIATRYSIYPYIADGGSASDKQSLFEYGFGGPLVAYNHIFWRTLTFWHSFTEDDVFQFETSVSVRFASSNTIHYVIGLQLGLQSNPRQRNDYIYEYYETYDEGVMDDTSYDITPSIFFFGGHITVLKGPFWAEFAIDLSPIKYYESYNYFLEREETEISRVGLSIGMTY